MVGDERDRKANSLRGIRAKSGRVQNTAFHSSPPHPNSYTSSSPSSSVLPSRGGLAAHAYGVVVHIQTVEWHVTAHTMDL